MPNASRWERRHFPADVQSYPAKIDQERELARGEELDREADALCDEVVQLLKAQPECEAYLLFNPDSRVDPALRGRLAERLRTVDRRPGVVPRSAKDIDVTGVSAKMSPYPQTSGVRQT
jgi:hypothetical protein